MTAPVIESLSAKLGEKMKFLKLNKDENPKTAMEFRVMAILRLSSLRRERKLKESSVLFLKTDSRKNLPIL